MKRINKIRIKYVLLVSFFVILATILPTFMRYQVSVTANVVGYAKETRRSTYQVIFHSNYGTDETKSMTINYNETKKLLPNTFTREDYYFSEWNTLADGSGTNYTDEQEINNTTYVDGNVINLYAQWTQNITYRVEYNGNGGTGEGIEPQVFEHGVSQKLKKNTFIKEDYAFLNWNTLADGTGTSYEDEEEVNNLTNVSGETITLYAIYDRERYIHDGDITFDGQNGENPYIDTEIYLFSARNIKKNFEVSFEIKSRGSNEIDNDSYLTGEFPTIMSAMSEKGEPWPGIVYRVFNESQEQLVANATRANEYTENYDQANVQKVTFKRINGAIYLSINDGENVQLMDVSSMQTFNYPVVFGASYNASMQPQRWFKGILSNLKVVITDSDANIGKIKYDPNGGKEFIISQEVQPNTTYTLMKNTFTRAGYLFNGWNTKADGSGTAYADEQEVTNFVSAGESTTLYAQWRTYKYTVLFNINDGTTGSMAPQEFEGAIAKTLTPSAFQKNGYSFAFWNTKANGSGTSYEDQESVINLCAEENQTITLYAMYEQFSYKSDADLVFDENNYINTNIYLFSRKNVNKDFEISFEIKDYTNTSNYNTIISSLDEAGKPYPGFVFRINDSPEIENSTQEYNLEANASTPREINNCYPLETKKVVIKRVGGILYLKLDDNAEQQIIDYSTLNRSFYYPLTVGASLDAEFNAWRHFKGTISNLNITLSN